MSQLAVPTESNVSASNQLVEAANGVAFAYIFTRTDARDVGTTLATRDAQLDAVTTWGIPEAGRLDRLAGITQPVLAANGDNDRMVPTVNTHLLADRLPNAQLKIYPDAGHGFLFQYPAEFAAEVDAFLS